MPTKGDLLYRYDYITQQVESVEFVEEGLSDPTCTVPTWLCRVTGPGASGLGLFRTSVGSYQLSEREAIRAALSSFDKTLPSLLNQANELLRSITDSYLERSRLQARLAELSPQEVVEQ